MSEARLAGRRIRAVLFDYGHTLITYARPHEAVDAVYERIAELLAEAGHRRAEAAELVRDVHDRIEAVVAAHEHGDHLREIDLVAEERRAWLDAGFSLSDELLDRVTAMVQEAWWNGIIVAPGVVPTVTLLRERGLRIGICSNAPYRPASMRAQLEHLGIAPLVDAAVFSADIGWRKPAEQIFSAALEAIGATASETVMIGDRSREDVAGAHAVGMTAIRLREHSDDDRGGTGTRPEAVLDRLIDLPKTLFDDNSPGGHNSSDAIIHEFSRRRTSHNKGRDGRRLP